MLWNEPFFHPREEWIEKAESRIKKLEGEKAHKTDGQVEVGHPKNNPHPRVGWGVSVVAGFLGWTGSVLGFIVCVPKRSEG